MPDQDRLSASSDEVLGPHGKMTFTQQSDTALSPSGIRSMSSSPVIRRQGRQPGFYAGADSSISPPMMYTPAGNKSTNESGWYGDEEHKLQKRSGKRSGSISPVSVRNAIQRVLRRLPSTKDFGESSSQDSAVLLRGQPISSPILGRQRPLRAYSATDFERSHDQATSHDPDPGSGGTREMEDHYKPGSSAELSMFVGSPVVGEFAPGITSPISPSTRRRLEEARRMQRQDASTASAMSSAGGKTPTTARSATATGSSTQSFPVRLQNVPVPQLRTPQTPGEYHAHKRGRHQQQHYDGVKWPLPPPGKKPDGSDDETEFEEDD